ncbi:PTS sugar transporter subunit IIC, partial [Listeria monocytogenes]|nr:PTS sugar transporter subunit IIC [Listeria monocytogenes]
FALAFWDYQIQSKFKVATANTYDFGGDEDGI